MNRHSCVLYVLLVAGCASPPDDPSLASEQGVLAEGDIEDTEQAVQWNTVFSGYADVRSQGNWDAVDDAVGVIRNIPFADAGPNARASCGITFITPHFGITAAHCVGQDAFPNVTTDNVTVQQVNMSGLGGWPGLAALWSQAQVGGTWPNWTRGPALDCANNGYCATTYNNCKIRRRCHAQFGVHNCPASLANANSGLGTDLAVVECPTRPTSAAYVPVRPAPDGQVFTSEDAAGDDIEVRWYHELVHLAVDETDTDPNWPANNFANYSAYDPANNYHYQAGSQLQYIPLRSRAWPNGHPYEAQGPLQPPPFIFNDEMWVDAFFCHGTSGSGYFLAGTTWLHGPQSRGLDYGRLCVDVDDPGNAAEDTQIGTYIRPASVRILEALVASDRPPAS